MVKLKLCWYSIQMNLKAKCEGQSPLNPSTHDEMDNYSSYLAIYWSRPFTEECQGNKKRLTGLFRLVKTAPGQEYPKAGYTHLHFLSLFCLHLKIHLIFR